MSETTNGRVWRETFTLEEVEDLFGLRVELDDETRPFAAETNEDPVPGYDDWYRRQLERAARKAEAGETTYRSFEAVAAKFGY